VLTTVMKSRSFPAFFSRNWLSFVTGNKTPPLSSNNAASVLVYVSGYDSSKTNA